MTSRLCGHLTPTDWSHSGPQAGEHTLHIRTQHGFYLNNLKFDLHSVFNCFNFKIKI